MKSVVRRIGQQLFNALSGKGLAVLVNHGIADEKVRFKKNPTQTKVNMMQCVTPNIADGWISRVFNAL